MSKAKAADEMLSNVRRLLSISPYEYQPDSWFFPSDLIPFSRSLKSQCNRLFTLGLLERYGDGTNRWGYSYRVKALASENANDGSRGCNSDRRDPDR